MMTVEDLYKELQELIQEGLGGCQLYGVRSPLMLKKHGKMHENEQLKIKYIDISDDENW